MTLNTSWSYSRGTYTSGGIKHFNPAFVPKTQENERLKQECSNKDGVVLRVRQRRKYLYITLWVAEIGDVCEWQYMGAEVDKTSMNHRWELRFQKEIFHIELV